MERLVKGDIVVLPFPTFDQTTSKKRPAFVVATTPKGVILCPITSQKQENFSSIKITDADFSSGKVNKESYVLCAWVASFKYTSIPYKIGSLKQEKTAELMKSILSIMQK